MADRYARVVRRLVFAVTVVALPLRRARGRNDLALRLLVRRRVRRDDLDQRPRLDTGAEGGPVTLIVVPVEGAPLRFVRARYKLRGDSGERSDRAARRHRAQARDDLSLHLLAEGRGGERAGDVHHRPAPDRRQADAVRAVGGCGRDARRDGKPAFNGFQTYARMAAENNDFNVNMGDTIYSDSEVAAHRLRSPVPPSGGSTSSGWRSPDACPPRVDRRCTATGTTTSSSTTSPGRERRRDLRGGREGIPRLPPGAARPGTASIARSAGARTSSCSSSTSARSAAARPATACSGDLAPTAPAAVRSAFAALARRSRSRSRRPVSTRSTTRTGRCSVARSSSDSSRRSRRRARPGRS